MVHLPAFALVFTASLLLIAVSTDLLWRKVHNLVTVPLLVCGMLYHTLQSGFAGFLISAGAILAAVGLLIVPFLKGGLGAGDIKLLAGLGAWTLFPDVVWIFGMAGLLFGLLSLWSRWKVIPFALLLAIATVARFLMTRGFRDLSTAMEVQV